MRVLGCLIEKQRTTPDAYPLTLNSLRLACNQSTNRDPVLELDEGEIRAALDRLGQRRWTRLASWSSGRTMKYRHMLGETLDLDERADQPAGRAHAARRADAGRAPAAHGAAAPLRRGRARDHARGARGARPRPSAPAPARPARAALRAAARRRRRRAARHRAAPAPVAAVSRARLPPPAPTASTPAWSGSSRSLPRCARSCAPCARSWARERALRDPRPRPLAPRPGAGPLARARLRAPRRPRPAGRHRGGRPARARLAVPRRAVHPARLVRGGGRRPGARASALALGAAARGRAMPPRASRRSASCAPRTAAGSPAAAPAGCPPGRAAGRSEPAERWTWARAPPRRCRASCTRSGSSSPSSLSIEALVRLPNGLAMVVGLATVADASEPVADDEHDEWAWWDPDPDRWPEHADDRVRTDGALPGGGALGAIAGHADRAGDARAADAAVPVRVLREVLLVVVLGVVERPRRLDLGRDLAVARALESLGVSVA